MEVEYDGIEVKEVMASPDDCQIVLTHNRVRFILVMIRPTNSTDGDIVEEWFQKIEEAEMDPDEMANDECLEELRESAISACKDTMYTLSSSMPVAAGQERQSLEDFLHPTTFCLQLFSEQGSLQARKINDTAKYVHMFEPVILPGDLSLPRSLALTPVSDLDFVEDLYMGHVLKVSKTSSGQVCVFKSAHDGSKDQLVREVRILQQIAQQWAPDQPARPAVPRLLGLVERNGRVMGILVEFVDGDRPSELPIDEIPAAQRQEWRRQIEHDLTLLHQHGFIWGDVKADNVLVDRHGRPWLVDFGGSCTDGWVDEQLAETMEGDVQGLQRLAAFLLSGRTESLADP